MLKALSLIGAIALALTLSGCGTSASGPVDGGSTATVTPPANLVPPAPGTEIKAVDPSFFDVGFSEFLFRAGDGPV